MTLYQLLKGYTGKSCWNPFYPSIHDKNLFQWLKGHGHHHSLGGLIFHCLFTGDKPNCTQCTFHVLGSLYNTRQQPHWKYSSPPTNWCEPFCIMWAPAKGQTVPKPTYFLDTHFPTSTHQWYKAFISMQRTCASIDPFAATDNVGPLGVSAIKAHASSTWSVCSWWIGLSWLHKPQ